MRNINQLPAISFVLITTLKLLLIPSYKSTDFDVHRNWLAITHHLRLSEWYFDDGNGTTVHTLDYPPSFAFFEYFLSNNFITQSLIKRDYLDGRCLALLPDHDNDVGLDCVIFHRCTVIFADVIFIMGACALARSLQDKKHNHLHNQRNLKLSMMLVMTNSGLFVLDHIHFQYNGMMLGILLASLACFMQSIKITSQSSRCMRSRIKFELLGSVLFALLLTFKHLYLTLAPMYFFYLLRRFCFINLEDHLKIKDGSVGSRKTRSGKKQRVKFSVSRLVLLGSVVLATIVIPFAPFLMDGKDQMMQILSRLFPFQRGLCHDYWAGNIWAMYLFLEKVCSFLSRTHPILYKVIPSQFSEISPFIAASVLFIGLLPAMRCAHKSASNSLLSVETRQDALLYCAVYSSLTSFMLAYHVHEKAIMTAILPMTYLSFRSKEGARLFLRISAIGHFGLSPLLFRPQELLVKALLQCCYLALCIFVLETVHSSKDHKQRNDLLLMCDKIGIVFMVVVFLYSEVLHGCIFGASYEFLPLMITSMYCALGLFGCWVNCGIIVYKICDE